jgi:hypothetical protein
MPNMANITVKAADGTTDVIFTALSPAGADGSPAVWRYEDTARLPGDRVRFEVSSRWNGPKDARKVNTFLNAPIIQATAVAGVNQRIGNMQFRDGGATLPQNVADLAMANAAAYYANLLKSTLIQSVFTTGYAPN